MTHQDDMIRAARAALIDSLKGAHRRMLKKAYAATTRRPLHIVNGPQALMQKCAEHLIDRRLLRLVPEQYFAVVLTDEGFAVALELSRQGWPGTEKPRPAAIVAAMKETDHG